MEAALAGDGGKMVGETGGRRSMTPFPEAFGRKKELDGQLLALTARLAV